MRTGIATVTEFIHMEHEPEVAWRSLQPGDLIGLVRGVDLLVVHDSWTDLAFDAPASRHILTEGEVYLVLKKEIKACRTDDVRVCLSGEEGNIIWSGWNPEPQIKLISRPAE